MDTDKIYIMKKLEKLKESVNINKDGKHDHNGRIKILDKLISYLEND